MAGACRDGLVKGEPDRHELARFQRAIQDFLQVVHDDQSEDLVIADNLRQGPTGIPALFTVRGRVEIVLAVHRVVGFRETSAHRNEQLVQVIQNGFVVDALGLRLFLHGPVGPSGDQDARVPLDDNADFCIAACTDQVRINGHPGLHSRQEAYWEFGRSNFREVLAVGLTSGASAQLSGESVKSGSSKSVARLEPESLDHYPDGDLPVDAARDLLCMPPRC